MNIILGTAQFGANYGITNKSGIVTNEELEKIFLYCESEGIRYLDTASAYGSAELRIGKIKQSKKLNVINKIKFTDSSGEHKQTLQLYDELLQSLSLLDRNIIDVLLVHDAWKVQNDKIEYYTKWLDEIKKNKLVKKVGLSIYDEEDIVGFDLKSLDIIQVPLSVYVNDLLDLIFQRARSCRVEIHARSIFLQGLILSNVKSLPVFTKQSIIKHHQKFIELAKMVGANGSCHSIYQIY